MTTLLYRILGIYILMLTAFSCTYAQKKTYYAGFYNVENLFDTIDQPHNDDEFLPNGKYQWTQERYKKKLQSLNRVIDSMGNLVLLGLCEVENKQVIEDLNAASDSRKNFKIVHHESPDMRGIDVGLMYDPVRFKCIEDGFIRFQIPNPTTPHTRDILWAKLTYKKDTLFVLVNHWPSRRGGQEASNGNRLVAAQSASKFIDSVMLASPKSKIILMGDLNDYPENDAPKMIAERLKPMITEQSGVFGGSYFYRKQWNILDHIFLSSNAFSGKINFVDQTGKILSPDFLLEEHKGHMQPKRNYAGPNYLDGYSDHLPVRVELQLK